VGVGEFGLDFGPYSELGPEVQADAFVEQLRLAHELKLPVELHLRDEEDGVHSTGHDLALEVLRSEGVPAEGCDLHCYTSGPEVLEPFTRLGCHAAFGGAVTFARSEDIRVAAAACPAHLLLSETDSPYMAPVPLRGLECQPAMVAYSAACVAAVRDEAGVSAPVETYQALWNNACTLLRRR
jgi:TatD DNase family protein